MGWCYTAPQENPGVWPEQAERAMARFETEHGYRPELLVNLAAAASVWQPN